MIEIVTIIQILTQQKWTTLPDNRKKYSYLEWGIQVMIKSVHFGVLRHWHQLSTFLLLLLMSPSFRGLLPLDPDTFNCPVATGEHGGQAGMKYLRHVIYCVSRWHLLMEFCLRKLRPRIHDSQKWTQNESKWPHSERLRTRLYTGIRHLSYLSSVLEFGGEIV